METVDQRTEHPDRSRPDQVSGFRGWLGALGPGLVTGASDDDPSGIATYSQTGAQFGYSMLWTSLITFPLMAAVQEICDRTALATGQSLGELCRQRFRTVGRLVVGVLLVALLVANTLNITADAMAVGAGMHLLGVGPEWLWTLLAGVAVTALVVSGSFSRLAAVFKVLCLSLAVYLVVLVFADVDWSSVASSTFVPHVEWSTDFLALLVAVLGTTISPYLFFWQTAHRVEELAEEDAGGDQPLPLGARAPRRAKRKLRRSRMDVLTGMGLSNLVMFAIITATAATLHRNGVSDIGTAADAAEALRPVAGNWSAELFALGFVGTGMLAIPVLAGSGSAGLSGLLGRNWGYSEKVTKAPFFYALVVVGTLGGTLLSLAGMNPMNLLIVVAVVNGVAAAPFLVVVMVISGDRGLMGRYRNGRFASVLGWTTAAVMAVAAVALLYTLLGS